MSKFITFEGGEGCGKSTQMKLLAEFLRAQGKEVVTTREPGGTEGAEEIRKLLLGASKKYDAKTEVLLNFAARMDHVNNLIKPALKRGAYVISDRFFDSTYVYQGYCQGVDKSFIDEIRETAIGDFAPDQTFILDLDPKIGLDRANKRGDTNHFEAQKLEFHQKVRKGFLQIVKNEPKRCVVVDAGKTVEEIKLELLKAL